jgi:hypothetical protein
MTTPEQATQCCSSMPCMAQGHDGQDRCKSMPFMHAPFVRPTTIHLATHGLAASAADGPVLADSETFTTRSLQKLLRRLRTN